MDGTAASRWPGAEWELADPASFGLDPDALQAAADGAVARAAPDVADMKAYLDVLLTGQSHAEVIGPLRNAAGASGVVVHRNAVVASWGDPAAVEMSFSVSKTYLSVVAGVAFDRGLIGDLDSPVGATVVDDAFADAPHDRIAWRHLLTQSSEWAGTLWGKPWWADPQGGQAHDAELGEPGSVFAYNDVRINLLASALTRIWGRSLANVLRSEVMDPIGASSSWEWLGYENSTVDGADGPIAVVSGGAHWGGGVWMSAYDHARLGLLFLRRGRADDNPVLDETWLASSLTPSTTNRDYGLLWWLNHRGRIFPAAPPTGFCARGNLGRQLVWVDPARDLVVVSRWSDDVGRLLAEVSAVVDG